MNLEQEILPKIKSIAWDYLANRSERPLFVSLTLASYDHFAEVTGLPIQITGKIRLGNYDIYYDKEFLDKIRQFFSQGGTKVLTDFKRRLIKNVENFDKIGKSLEKINFSSLTNQQLQYYAEKYFAAALLAHAFLVPMPVADKALTQMILDKLPPASANQKQQWLAILIFPVKENFNVQEEKAFFHLAQAYLKKENNFPLLIKKHLQQFSWIGSRWYWLDYSWTEKDLLQRLEHFASEKKNPLEEKKYLQSLGQERKNKFKELLKELKISKISELFYLIKTAQEYAYLRTWRTDVMYRAGYYAKEMFKELAHRGGMDEKYLVYLTHQEVLDLAHHFKCPVSLAEIKQRQEACTQIHIHGKKYILSGKEWVKKISLAIGGDSLLLGEIKGSIAFPGKVTGKVKLVFTSEDIPKVQPGDVLVTVMTFPHFIPAMEKAAAFVTDEGGILCHAAIVSREMKKPCIIATKNATKMLKDGDLVEVDAHNGIVRKIK